jgi:hypothetical protein
MIRSIDAALAAIDRMKREMAMDAKQLFDGFDPAQYEDEARERWGAAAIHANTARER